MPIIAVSADALAERRSAALTAGCNAYVTKPIDFDELLSTLDALLVPPPLKRRRRNAAARATIRRLPQRPKPLKSPTW